MAQTEALGFGGSGVEENHPEERPADDAESPWGLYSTDHLPRWSCLSPDRGMVIAFNIPADYITESGEVFESGADPVEMSLVIMEKQILEDGSYLIGGRSLGTNDTRFTPRMSSLFKRKSSFVHICPGAMSCSHEGLAVFHLTTLWLYSNSGFYRSYVGSAGKRLLKQALEAISGIEAEELPEDDAGKVPTHDVAAKGKGGVDPKKRERERGKEKDPGKDAKERVSQADELRKKLRDIQCKKVGIATGGAPGAPGKGLSVDGSEEDSASPLGSFQT